MGLDEPVGEESIDEPGGKATLGCQISTLHHLSSWERNKCTMDQDPDQSLVALDFMPAKKQIMSNRFKLASGVCEVQADGFVIFVMIIIILRKRLLTLC